MEKSPVIDAVPLTARVDGLRRCVGESPEDANSIGRVGAQAGAGMCPPFTAWNRERTIRE